MDHAFTAGLITLGLSIGHLCGNMAMGGAIGGGFLIVSTIIVAIGS